MREYYSEQGQVKKVSENVYERKEQSAKEV
jgi:hypothetical protein